MLNKENISNQPVEFTELVDSEMEQISGGDKIIQIFNPYSFAAPYGFIGPGFGVTGGAGGAGGAGGGGGAGGAGGGNPGKGKKKGHYK